MKPARKVVPALKKFSMPDGVEIDAMQKLVLHGDSRRASRALKKKVRAIMKGGGELSPKRNNGILVTEAQVRLATEEAIASIEKLNLAFQAMGLPGRFDTSALKDRVSGKRIDSDWIATMTPVVQGKFKGSLVPEQVCTVCQVVRTYFSTDMDIGIWGACQLAKTLITAFNFLLLPVLERAYNNRLAIPVINVPNAKNLSLGARKELETTLAVYADVVFEHDGRSLKLDYVKTAILDGELRTEGAGANTWDALVLQRHNYNMVEFVKLKREVEDCVVISFTDEIHFGSAKEGVIDKWEKEWEQEGKGSEVRELKKDMRRLGISATPSEIISSASWYMIPMVVPANYSGIIVYNGMRLLVAPGVKISRPKVLAIEDALPELAEFLQGLSDSAWKTWGERRKNKFALAVWKVYSRLATQKHPIVFFRAFRQVANCQDLQDRIEKQIAKSGGLETHKILRCYDAKLPKCFGDGKKTELRTTKEVLIDDYVAGGFRCLIMFSSGRGKMGDSFPWQVKHYIDMFEQSQVWNTVIQGPLGRSQGFDKESVVYFRKYYADAVNNFIDNGCKEDDPFFGSRDLGLRDRWSGMPARRGRPASFLTLRFNLSSIGIPMSLFANPSPSTFDFSLEDDADSTAVRMFHLLRENLARWKRVEGSSMGANRASAAPANRHCYEEIFSPEMLEQLAAELKNVEVVFPEWGTRKKDSNLYYGYHPNGSVDPNYSAVGMRWSRGHDEWTGGKGVAVKNIRITDQTTEVCRPQIVVMTTDNALLEEILLPGDKGGKYTVRVGGGADGGAKRYRPCPNQCPSHPLWNTDKFAIVPFRIAIPILSLQAKQQPSQGSMEERRNSVARRSRSRHGGEDAHLDVDERSDVFVMNRELNSQMEATIMSLLAHWKES